MKSKLFQNKLSIRKSYIQGYGVFAETHIAKDEIIEECYGIINTGYEPELMNYYFCVGKGRFLLPTGFGMVYNHHDQPNAVYRFDAENSLLILKADKNIRKGDEIFISYGEHWFHNRNAPKKNPSWRYYLRKLSQTPLVRGFFVMALCYLPILLLKH